MKLRRQELILELIEREVGAPEELEARLRRRGVDAATGDPSRDIRDLRLVGGGGRRVARLNGRPAFRQPHGLRRSPPSSEEAERVRRLAGLRTGAGTCSARAAIVRAHCRRRRRSPETTPSGDCARRQYAASPTKRLKG
jgi:arginine repressor